MTLYMLFFEQFAHVFSIHRAVVILGGDDIDFEVVVDVLAHVGWADVVGWGEPGI